MRAANEEIDAFCESAAQDLRGPARQIERTARTLVASCGSTLDSETQTHVEGLLQEAQRLERLLDDLERLSQLTRAELRKQEVDLVSIAESSIARLRLSAPDRSVVFRAQGPSRAQADPALVTVVLDNLLDNAWKFTAGRTAAEIVFGTSSNDRGRTTYFVRDNGVGFDMAASDQLFGPFPHGRSSQERHDRGIGLATVRRIVHRHGGRVWAESTPGHGATIYFTLEDSVTNEA